MRYLYSIFLILIIFSCNEKNRIVEIDMKVNNQIIERFNQYDSNLWNDLENEFYNRMVNMKIFESNEDSLATIKDFMNTIIVEGYSKEFFVNFDNPKTEKLITDLRKIDFIGSEYSVHNFLYNLTKREIDINLQDYPRDLLVAFATTNPDSLKLGFDISAFELNKQYTRKDLERPGLYKELILFYFSRMIDKDFQREGNYE
jgi:hypothetical protein